MRGLYKEYLTLSDNSNSTCVITDKHHSRQQYIAYMLDRTSSMFEYENLPETIPAYMLELYLQIFGYAGFLEIDGSIQLDSTPHIKTKSGVHIFYGGIGGERDIYYRPKLFTVANPRFKNSIQATIVYPGDDYSNVKTPCVIMPCDTNMMGLIPLFDRYAQQLTENDISIRSAQINARALLGISTSTDRDRESAKNFIQKLIDGEIAILGESNFLDSMSIANVSTSSSNTIIQLIELQQYLKASWFNELGLNVNFNMKREYMSEEEVAVNTDILLPLVDDMLRCRETYIELINSLFKLNIQVHKSSAWANKEQEEINALGEASLNGQIPLKDTIKERIDKDTTNEEAISKVQQETVSGNSGAETGTEQGQSIENRLSESQGLGTPDSAESAGVQELGQDAGQPTSNPVEVNINVATDDSSIQIDDSFESSTDSNNEEKEDDSE